MSRTTKHFRGYMCFLVFIINRNTEKTISKKINPLGHNV